MKTNIKTFIILGIILVLIGASFTIYMVKKSEKTKVVIETSKGNIVIELNDKLAPITVENFLSYVNSGFYSNTIFHRVIAGFMIQGGGFDANGKEKTTNKPIKLESQNGLKNLRGTIAMARTAIPDSATSQFFINTKNNTFLDYGFRDEGYAVFGSVIEGMDVVDAIEKVETNGNDEPLQKVIIKSVKVV